MYALATPDAETTAPAAPALPDLDEDTAVEVELRVKYAGYIRKEQQIVQRARRLEDMPLAPTLDFRALPGLRGEARGALERVRPRTIGQATRIPGVTPADISILLVQCERLRRSAARGVAADDSGAEHVPVEASG